MRKFYKARFHLSTVKRITLCVLLTALICIPSFASRFLGAFSAAALQVDTQIESPPKNNNAHTLPEARAGDTVSFQLFVLSGAGQLTNGYELELDLPGKTFSNYIGTISGTDWNGRALLSNGPAKLSALFISGVIVPSTGYLGQVNVQVKKTLESGKTLTVKSLLMTSGNDVDQLNVSNAHITFAATVSGNLGDFDNNGSVNIADFLAFVNVYGTTYSGDGTPHISPDLVVESPTVSDNTLTPGQSFTLRATVHNQGNSQSASTTLVYYLSSNATIWADDTRVGTDSVSSLSASNTSSESIRLSAPSSAGTYYYGACVASVSGESDTDNNCSTGVRVTVSSGGNLVAGPIRRLTNHWAYDLIPSWSPDGRHIAFVSTRDDPSGEIYVMGSDGSNPRRLTNNSAVDEFPSWSPDGRHIAFSSERNGNLEIYVMGSDGSNPRRLTNNSGLDFFPSWSPDGRHIAFVSERDFNLDIYVMEVQSEGIDGTPPPTDSVAGTIRRLTNHWAVDTSPSWSPDGRYIAFSSTRDGNNFEIYMMGSDGSNPRRLTNNSAVDTSPSWSPDGRYIAFESWHDVTAQIYVMGSDGSNPRRLINDWASNSNPSWSPDGRHIAFDRGDQIYVMDSDGSNPRRLTNNNYSAYSPTWSPDSRHLALQRGSEIYVMGSDGSNPRRLINDNYSDGSPSWSPDGRHIAFVSERDGNTEIYVMELQTEGGGQ